MTDKPMRDLRGMAREMAKRSIVTEATARLLEQVFIEANAYHVKRITDLEAALAPFAELDGVAVPRMKVPPEQDRLWSYYDSRHDKQYEITRAHIIEAARVLKTLEK